MRRAVVTTITDTGRYTLIGQDITGPVSYTHLDVYKRQIQSDIEEVGRPVDGRSGDAISRN